MNLTPLNTENRHPHTHTILCKERHQTRRLSNDTSFIKYADWTARSFHSAAILFTELHSENCNRPRQTHTSFARKLWPV